MQTLPYLVQLIRSFFEPFLNKICAPFNILGGQCLLGGQPNVFESKLNFFRKRQTVETWTVTLSLLFNNRFNLNFQESIIILYTSMARKQLPCAKSCLLDSEIHCSCLQFRIASMYVAATLVQWPLFAQSQLSGRLFASNLSVCWVLGIYWSLSSVSSSCCYRWGFFLVLETPRSWRGTSLSSHKLPSLSW